MSIKRNILFYIETGGPGGAERVLLNIDKNNKKVDLSQQCIKLTDFMININWPFGR